MPDAAALEVWRAAPPARLHGAGSTSRRARARSAWSATVLALASAGSIACAARAPSPAASAATERAAPPSALAVAELAGATTWLYRAPRECPGRAHFLEQLSRRLRPLSAGEVAVALGPRVDVDVHEGGGDWRGRVAFRGAEGPMAREVTGADCDEVVVALALITSLWMRPESGARDAPAATASASAAADGALVASAAPDASVQPDAIRLDRAARATPEPDGASDTSRAMATSDEASSASSAARFQIAGLLGYASEPSGALAARLQLERWGSREVSSWSASLGAAFSSGQHENDRLGRATLRLLHGQLELCPPGIDVSDAAWLRACAHGRAGALHFSAGTERVPNARSLWRPWAALGAGLHVGVPLAASLSLRLVTEISAVLMRDEFATERSPAPGVSSSADVFTFYEISPVSFDVGLGAAHVF